MCKATTRWRSWILPWRDSGNPEFSSKKGLKRKKEMTTIKCVFGWAAIAVAAFALISGIRTIPAMGASDKPEVKIDNFSFGPATITIPAGSTVTWTNNDDVPHVVTSDDNKMFKSKTLDTDEHFSFTFTKPGTYNYHCAIHPKMTAKIVVQWCKEPE
jgi:plastocyanin